MTKKEYWDKKTPIELKIGDKKSKGTLCNLPIQKQDFLIYNFKV